jgi:hypothetical protein
MRPARSWPGFKEDNMSISLSTDHFLLDDQGLTFRAFGNEISMLHNCSQLIVERLSDGNSWNWRRGFGRWRVRNGDIVDGWVDRS